LDATAWIMLAPNVSEYMTAVPHTVGRHETLATARRLMREYGVRHLLVSSDDRVTGLLSDRDLHVAALLGDADLDAVRVEDAMTSAPLIVPPSAPLDDVAGVMFERRLDAAVVVQADHPVGIFTSTDALYALSRLVRLARG
jgi:CBS domain-containing protein